jgi:hypothetical protein
MTRHQAAALRLTLALLAVSATFLVIALIRGPAASVPVAHACCSGSFYGADTTKTINAVTPIFPEYTPGCNCGVETAMAITNYADEVQGWSLNFTHQSDQTTVDTFNDQTTSESQWGYATPSGGESACGKKANISKDYGTDPRAIAWDTWDYTPPNWYFHDYIYRWDLFHGSPPAYSQQVLEATSLLAQVLENWTIPLSVAIDGGFHSVLVTGVWSNNDPYFNFPAALTGVVIRDPLYPASSSRYILDYNTWATGVYSGNHYKLWSIYYGDVNTPGDHGNTSDPEPVVGPYTPDPSNGYPWHWYEGFTWIQRDGFATNPDFAYVPAFGSQAAYQMSTP